MESKVNAVAAEHTLSFRALLIPIGLGLTMLLATWLRFYRLAGQSLWSDEGNSVALAQAPLGEIASRTALDIHPPLYYWLLHGWMRVFGESEVAVRSLSAVTGVLLVGVVYGLGTRLFDRRVGLIAALIAAVSPFQIYYAQEARMYALLALLGALTVWATVHLARAALHDVSIMAIAGWAFLYVLGATLGLYTHYAFPVILVVTNLVALIWLWRRRREKSIARWVVGWLTLQLVPLMLYLPWLPTAWRQLTTWPAPPPTNAGNAWVTIFRTLSFGPAGAGRSNFWLKSYLT